MDPLSPLRNDARNDSPNAGGSIPCPVCQQRFVPSGRQRVCSAACRQALWRQRHPTRTGLQMTALLTEDTIPVRATRATTVYECPTCEARYLGEQRCPDCGVFCRRVGPGGRCPHCDEPVALADILPQPTNEGGDHPPTR